MISCRLKRVCDLVFSLLAVVALSPVLLAVAIAIRLESPGPAIFRQTRVGRNQVPFEVFKFRSMKHNPQQRTDLVREGTLHSHDPRITRVGRALRSTSLDELPQLLNVIRGQMSIVGPRPPIEDQLTAIAAANYVRFNVRPGITGLAQVSGRRDLPWPEQLRLDRRYVEAWSLHLDLVILVRTIAVLVRPTGIYGSPKDNWRSFLRTNDPGRRHD